MIRTIRFRMTHFLALSVALCVFSVSLFGFLLVESNKVQKTKITYSSSQIVAAVNKYRLENKLPALLLDEKLEKASQDKAKNMIEHNYFSHISPKDGVRWSVFIQQSDYPYIEAGENLANGYSSVDEVVTAWLNSPSHKENILTPEYKDTGVAVQTGFLDGKPTIFVVQLFGEKEDVGFVRKV